MPELYALKEWAVICAALDRGLQIITLRKGGIEEEEGQFALRYPQFLLYPTFEHQNSADIQSQQLTLLENSKQGANSLQIIFNLWAKCERVVPVTSKEMAKALAGFTIWTSEALAKRFELYPTKPLLLLFLRAYHLNTPLIAPENPSYAGCRSWVPLVDLALPAGIIGPPVLPDNVFHQTAQEIDAIVKS